MMPFLNKILKKFATTPLSNTTQLQQYSNLEQRINEIIDTFEYLIKLDVPDDKKQDFIRSFILLSHAEFEQYLESLAKELLETGKAKWISEKIANYNISSLFISSNLENSDTALTKAGKIFSDYLKTIDSNHGIKEENIRKLFNPLGLPPKHFDASFLSTLDSFGSERGSVAHSSAVGIQQELDFNTIKDITQKILEGFLDFKIATTQIPT